MINTKLDVSFSPHYTKSLSTNRIMLIMMCCLLPLIICGVVAFGVETLYLVLTCVCSCVIAEMGVNLIQKKQPISDLSPIITGLVLSCLLSPAIHLHYAFAASLFAIVIIKMIFGGIGKNIINPAAGGMLFVLLGFSKAFEQGFKGNISAKTTTESWGALFDGQKVKFVDLLFNSNAQTICSVCFLAIVVGAIVLICFKVIDWKIVVLMLASFTVFCFAFFGISKTPSLLFQTEVLFVIFFMATDIVTSPNSLFAKMIYAVLIGFLSSLFLWLGLEIGAAIISLILIDLIVPILDLFIVRIRPFKEKA